MLRAELLSWPGVQARPMMGALAFFKGNPRHRRGEHMLGCYVNRALSKKKPQWLGRPGEPTYAWMRLRPADAERALKRKAVRPSRLGGSRTQLARASGRSGALVRVRVRTSAP